MSFLVCFSEIAQAPEAVCGLVVTEGLGTRSCSTTTACEMDHASAELSRRPQVGVQTVLVPFEGSTGLSAASIPGATTIDISIQQPLCGTVTLASFGYIITSSTVSLPNADLGDVSVRRPRDPSARILPYLPHAACALCLVWLTRACSRCQGWQPQSARVWFGCSEGCRGTVTWQARVCHRLPCCTVLGCNPMTGACRTAADSRFPALTSSAAAVAAAAALGAISAASLALDLLDRFRRNAFHVRKRWCPAAGRLDICAGPELPDLRQLARRGARLSVGVSAARQVCCRGA